MLPVAGGDKVVMGDVVALDADPPTPLVEGPEEAEVVVEPALVGTLAGDELGCDEDPIGWTLEPEDAAELDLLAPGPVAVPVGVGGRSPLETEDKEDSVAGPEVPGAEVPGAEVPGAEVPGAKVPGAEVPGAEVPGTTVLEAEVTVTGQTVVETGTIIVVTGQSLMLGPQL